MDKLGKRLLAVVLVVMVVIGGIGAFGVGAQAESVIALTEAELIDALIKLNPIKCLYEHSVDQINRYAMSLEPDYYPWVTRPSSVLDTIEAADAISFMDKIKQISMPTFNTSSEEFILKYRSNLLEQEILLAYEDLLSILPICFRDDYITYLDILSKAQAYGEPYVAQFRAGIDTFNYKPKDSQDYKGQLYLLQNTLYETAFQEDYLNNSNLINETLNAVITAKSVMEGTAYYTDQEVYDIAFAKAELDVLRNSIHMIYGQDDYYSIASKLYDMEYSYEYWDMYKDGTLDEYIANLKSRCFLLSEQQLGVGYYDYAVAKNEYNNLSLFALSYSRLLLKTRNTPEYSSFLQIYKDFQIETKTLNETTIPALIADEKWGELRRIALETAEPLKIALESLFGISGESVNTTLTDNATGVIVVGKLPTAITLVVTNKSNITVDTDIQELLSGYDITLQVNGQLIQPTDTVTVKIPIPAGATDTSKLKVYRIESNGDQTDMSATVQGGYLVFATNHFSEYAVISTLSPPVHQTLTYNELRDTYPQYVNDKQTYWNHVWHTETNPPEQWGNNVTTGDFGGYKPKLAYDEQGHYTLTPCHHPQDSGVNCNQYTVWNSAKNDYEKTGYAQCNGFAHKLGFDAYGTDPRGWTLPSNLLSYINNDIKPGDIIRVKKWSADDHTIFVTAVIGETIVFADCNSSGNCDIRWDATITKTYLRSKLSAGQLEYIRSAPKALDTSRKLVETTSQIEVIYQDGSVESGAILEVTNIRNDNTWFELKVDGNKFVVFFDINLMIDGKPTQPTGRVTVKIPLSYAAGNNPQIYHVTKGSSTPEPMNTRIEGNYLVFETDHFSVYGIAVDDDQPTVNTKDYFKLWGKTTKWKKNTLNWFLCIVCFGWIWMAF